MGGVIVSQLMVVRDSNPIAGPSPERRRPRDRARHLAHHLRGDKVKPKDRNATLDVLALEEKPFALKSGKTL
jgi:hypothetical protein